MNQKKYKFLTKEVLEKDYEELKSFKLIAEKYNVASSVIQDYCKYFNIKTIPKIRYNVNHDVFATDSEISFYLAGFIAADGCVHQHKCKEPNMITISLAKKDLNHLLNIKTLLGFNGPIKANTRKLAQLNNKWNDSEQVRFSIYSKKIISDLKNFGIGPRKSLTYIMPDWLKSHSLVHHFIRGYFDGDGSFWINTANKKPRLVFSLRGTVDFLSSIKEILIQQINLQSSTSPYVNNGQGQFSFKGKMDVKNVAKFLYKDSTILLDRKYEIAKDFI